MLPGDRERDGAGAGRDQVGLRQRSRCSVGPRELKLAIVSSARVERALVLDAPTVSTHGALPGAVMPPYCCWPCAFLPRLPAAATTTMPVIDDALVASVSGSVQYDSVTAAPTDRLTTRML